MTLASAYRGEMFKALRQRSMLFWAFLAAPLFVVLFQLAVELFFPLDPSKLGQLLVAQPLRDAAGALGLGGNPFAQLFFAVGAASLFAGDYRWETWRLTVPRNSRANLILGKLLVFLLFAALALILAAVGCAAVAAFGAVRHHSAVAWPDNAGQALRMLGAAFISGWLQLAATAALVALLAVLTRSSMGAVLPAFLFGIVQMIVQSLGSGPPDPRLILLPRFAGTRLAEWAADERGGPSHALAALALAILAGWVAVLTAAAVAAFQRQDLSRE